MLLMKLKLLSQNLLDLCLAKVINQAPTLSNLFSNFAFSADESPSIPMDLYYDITDEDYVTVWSQAVPGGLANQHSNTYRW